MAKNKDFNDNGFILPEEKPRRQQPKPMTPPPPPQTQDEEFGNYGLFDPDPENMPDILTPPENEEEAPAAEPVEQEPAAVDADEQPAGESAPETVPEEKSEEAMFEQMREEALRSSVAAVKDDSKSRKKKAKKKKKPTNATLVARILLSLFLIAGLLAIGIPRLQTAREAVRTAESEKITTRRASEASDVGEDPAEVDPETPMEYIYIEKVQLEKLSTLDLALWYAKEFPVDKPYNHTEYKEFRDWLDGRVEMMPGFESEFWSAVEYVEAHPELLHPVIEEPEPEPEEPAQQTPTTTTPVEQPTPSTTQPTQPDEPDSPLPGDIDSYSAAEAANWVYATFSAEEDWSLEDYATLTAFYKWLDKKPASYSQMVQDYLELLGWTISG